MNKIYFFFFIILLSSCQINGSFGGLVSHQKKLEKSNPNMLVKSNEDICFQSYKPAKVFIVNGKELLSCLSRNEKSLVHIWKPNCSSDLCIPLSNVEAIADDINATLYIVAEYYDEAKMKIDYKINNPILGIDCKYYKSSFTKKYLGDFLQGLLQKKDVIHYDYYLFEGSQLKLETNSYQDLQ